MTALKWAFHSVTVLNATWGEQLGLLERFGWPAAEVWYDKVQSRLAAGDTCAQLRRQLRDAGVRPIGLTPATIATAGAGKDAAEERAELERRLDLAAELEAGALTIVAIGEVGPDLEDEYRYLAHAIGEASQLAAARGLKLNVEFLGGMPILATLRSGIELINAVNHPAAGLLFDLCNYYTSASHLEDLRLLPKEKLFLVHVDDAPRKPMEALRYDERVFPGEGIIDVPNMLKQLRRCAGYDGYFSLEIFDQTVWQLRPEEAFQRAAKSRRYVEEQLGQ